ncbi:MAG TPA: flagellar hook-associated protein FlgK [Ignavibacteriales bacterium]|nr:flagellar hook-associated protein FlgK [Ignavibacteriales bacterium]HOL81294.1 flagellar hook-associated protein FlgK [Ignavibacteriales bacterium]HOM66050.1 flagellar hook-associated protein FlgK [Ignavibacteriales bacterium]HPD67542.1 flagellar hook-associated protein FlgK [Ignavibacteriales bacterium]HPP33404.1 flagellar hook-associated protein FlgK [Ignavibacteriales bacterium]
MLSKVFDIGRRSLLANQYAMNVTSHNLANVNTEGYTRQRVVFTAENPEYKGFLEWGSGVKIQEVTRIKNDLVNSQLLIYNGTYTDANKKSELLSQMESLLSEPSEVGISKLMNTFFNAWADLAANPSLSAYRQNLIQAADKLSNKFKLLNSGYEQLKVDIKYELEEKVKDLNAKLGQVKILNQKIFEARLQGVVANDMQDQRDKLVQEVAKYVNTKASINDKGHVSLSLGGAFGVDEGSSSEFKVVESTDGKLSIALVDDDNAKITLKSGELAALVDVYSNIIPKYKQTIDQMANIIVNKVNELHVQGFTLHQPPLGGKNSVNDPNAIKFFEGYINGELKINELILQDDRYITASLTSAPDNGENALRIANIAQSNVISGTTLNDFYSKFIVESGNDATTNLQKVEANKAILQQLQLQRDSYAGVSIDEEMTNMITYQRSYQASARVIKAADELLQSLLSMV